MTDEAITGSIISFIFAAIFLALAIASWINMGIKGFNATRLFGSLSFTFLALGPLLAGILLIAGVRDLPLFLAISGIVLGVICGLIAVFSNRPSS